MNLNVLRLTALAVVSVCSPRLMAETPAEPVSSRAGLLAQAKLPEAIKTPVPDHAISLPDNWASGNGPLKIQLTAKSSTNLVIRRVSHNDGRLYLELSSPEARLTGAAVAWGNQQLALQPLDGSLWLSLKPRIGRLTINVVGLQWAAPVRLTVPTTLVEIRGRQLYLNGEPFLMKGVMARGLNEADAAYVHSLGVNTLRGLEAGTDCERYGFMNISSLNYGGKASKKTVQAPDSEFADCIAPSLEWLRENSVAPIASPYTLILQLGNELTGGMSPPGTASVAPARLHVSQLLANARNLMKNLAPALPVGYASQDLSYLAPDCMDVYMHNSYLDKDRYGYPWPDFMRWQGCLPPDGPAKTGRPFVNSEFGANRYLCQSYLQGPNNPFLEKIHAWNLTQRWREFMEQGTVGGSIYCLHDLDTPWDQGCSRFGIMTDERQPKLACWDVGHMWRDFEVEPRDGKLEVKFKRDYWARDCRLTLSFQGAPDVIKPLDDFGPHTSRSVDIDLPSAGRGTNGFLWTIDFTTHSGLTNQAAGAWPVAFERAHFLAGLGKRDTASFLSQLFDTEVLTAAGKPAPGTLAEMTNTNGIVPVVLGRPHGPAYLLLISRDNPNTSGPIQSGLSIDVAFHGKVERVDDMTGQPVDGAVEAEPIPGGLRLKNIDAARIPGAIGARSKTPFKLPIYRITP